MYLLSFAAIALPFSTASTSLHKRVLNDPVDLYLSEMCYPLFTNFYLNLHSFNWSSESSIIGILASSPFPCEKQLYLQRACQANDTTALDYAAEQQCLCGSPFFEFETACNACYYAHGHLEGESSADDAVLLSLLRSAECSQSPLTQSYNDLLSSLFPFDQTSYSLAPSKTLADDRFPNNTAVSNYYTGSASAVPGSITGSATARVTTSSSSSQVLGTDTSYSSGTVTYPTTGYWASLLAYTSQPGVPLPSILSNPANGEPSSQSSFPTTSSSSVSENGGSPSSSSSSSSPSSSGSSVPANGGSRMLVQAGGLFGIVLVMGALL